ncbi:hypothetical protein HKD37_01G000755 [Glycine soja]
MSSVKWFRSPSSPLTSPKPRSSSFRFLCVKWLLVSEKLDLLGPPRRVLAMSVVFFLRTGSLCSAIMVLINLIRKQSDVFLDDPMASADVEDTGADIPADTSAQAAEDEHEGFLGGPSDPSVLTQYADHVACSERPELKLSSHGRKAVRAETGQCRGPYICLQWVRDIYERRCQAGHWTAAARAYLLHLLGCTLFANKSATNAHVVYLEAIRDLTALVHMYDQLNDVSISISRQLGGYITLLQVTNIFSFVETFIINVYHFDVTFVMLDKRTLSFSRAVDCNEEDREEHTYTGIQGAPGLTSDSGCRLDPIWGAPTGPGLPFDFMLFRSPAMGARCCTILDPPIDSWVSYDDIHDRWMHYSDHMVPTGEVCAVPGQCANDYMDWFFRISHPFMTPGQASDPLPNGHAPQPRVVPQALQTDNPHVSESGAPSTSARSAVEEPRHTVKVCHGIAERLERHLSLGVVTLGSSTHEVIKECLRMARSVTQDQLIYVRSRRKRRMDQA